MASKIQLIAGLSYIDAELQYLQEEFGDLPEQVQEKKENAEKALTLVNETEGILKDIRDFVATAKVTLVELKEKEDTLTKQQFMSRNNKEFDAVTKEVEFLKQEHERLSTRMRTEGVKEENILRILEDQKKEYQAALDDYEKINSEYEDISAEQGSEVKKLIDKRKLIIASLPADAYAEYSRIKQFHSEAAVRVKKNSCTGCYSAVPSQKIVELRNNFEKIYTCENCGRMLIPEEIEMNENLLDI